MKVITVLNFKGGVGKTETTKNLASGLAKSGKRVLILDNDPQANTTQSFDIDSKTLSDLLKDNKNATLEDIKELVSNNGKELGLEDLYKDPSKIKEAIRETSIENLWIIPTSLRLTNTEKEIKNQDAIRQEDRIQLMLRRVKDDFDYVIIDSAPALNLLTTNSLYATTEPVIIPIKVDRACLQGFYITLDFINRLNLNFNLDLDYKVLFTMVQKTSSGWLKECQTIMDVFEKEIPDKVFKSIIRNQSKAIIQATFENEIVSEKDTKVGDDYTTFVNEMIG